MLLEHLPTIVGQRRGLSGQHPDGANRWEATAGGDTVNRWRPDVYVCSGLLHFTAHKLHFLIFLTASTPQSTLTDAPPNCLWYNILLKLFYRCCRTRRGVHGHRKPTPSRPLCSVHSHQPAAPSFKEGISTKAFREYLPSLVGKSGAMGDRNRLRGNVSITWWRRKTSGWICSVTQPKSVRLENLTKEKRC